MKFSVIIDSNEYSHGKAWSFPSNRVHVRSLVKVGCDYSVYGQTGIIGVERKSFPDYVSCLGGGWKRFLKQLNKLQRNRYYCVIVEGSVDSPIPQQSRMVTSAVATQTAKVVSMGVPVLFGGTRMMANKLCLEFLSQALRRIRDG